MEIKTDLLEVCRQDLILDSIRNLPILFIMGEKDKLILDLISKFIKNSICREIL